MAITYRHQVGDSTVPGTGFDVNIKDLLVLLLIKYFLRDFFIIDYSMNLMRALGPQKFSDATTILLNNVLNGM